MAGNVRFALMDALFFEHRIVYKWPGRRSRLSVSRGWPSQEECPESPFGSERVDRYGVLMMRTRTIAVLLWACGFASAAVPFEPAARNVAIVIDSPMEAPRWARLERQLLDENVPACREFYTKYFDDRGYVQCFVRWGANDGPDDAFENFNRWPELHALGASDEILRMFLRGHDGLIKQYTEARTTDVPIARQGMYYKEFIVQSDWMHHGEGLQLFNRMGLSIPSDATYQARARRFAAFYMGEDPDAPNYDPVHKIIRSMENGSRGPMLRNATPIDWVGDPFDVNGFDALHGESTFEQFLAHYREYGDVAGDHFLNLVATTLPMNAYLIAGEPKYKRWIAEYMDGWLARMKQNNGIIPSFVDLDGTIGGPDRQWWKNAYGWGFSPVNPVTGRREDRNRIPRALVGFNNALLVTGDQKYVDAWRGMIGCRQLSRPRQRRQEAVSDDVRRGRVVRMAGCTLECRRAGGLVLVATARRSRARRTTRLARVSRRAQQWLSRTGARTRSQVHPAASDRHAARHDTS